MVKASHWGNLRRPCRYLRSASQKTCLNVCSPPALESGVGGCILCAEKRLQQSKVIAAVFYCHQVNIAYPIWFCDPVRIRNNRPLLCLAIAMSQKAGCIGWVDHALTGECNRACAHRGSLRLHFFLCNGSPHGIRGGMLLKPEEKKAWAEELLRQKYQELGRLPTKKDFDNADCARIKAFLGPWPRALEAAGLKLPKEEKLSKQKGTV